MSRFVPLFIADMLRKGRLSGNLTAFTMFIDISGFTPMTERLMESGKEGSEILSRIINQIFTPCIQAVYSEGGFISSFAGDAFTAIFHRRKSEYTLNAAFAINALFKDRGRITTKAGDFSLSVKIGLSWGKVNYMIIPGDIQNTWYFRGEAIDGCALSEHKADTMQVVADHHFKSRMPYISDHKRTGKNWSIITPELVKIKPYAGKKEKRIPVSLQESFVPPSVTRMKDTGEFREVISCFINFREEYNFHDAIKAVIKQCHDYGGYFNRVDFGDKGGVILVLFGAPVGKEKLYERACDFALSLKPIKGFVFRAGLAAGTAYAGFVGSKLRSEYTALGSRVNLASRLMMQAPWEGIVAGPGIRRHLSSDYRFRSLGKKQIKGFGRKIELSLLESKASEKYKRSYSGRFIGRQDEIKRLLELIYPVFEGNFGGIIYIEGIAGIGKSRLISSFSAIIEERKANVLFMPCDEILRKSLNPFIHMLKEYFAQDDNLEHEQKKACFEIRYMEMVRSIKDKDTAGELARKISVIGALLGYFWENSLYSHLDAKERFENTLNAVKQFIKARSMANPTLLILDDAHWIDRDSIEMIEHLTRNVEKYPFIILALCRPDDKGGSFLLPRTDSIRSERLKLMPFGRRMLRKLIIDRLDISEHCLPEKTEDFIWEKSRGNPFYAEQITLYLRENRLFDDNFRLIKQAYEIPSGINRIIIARIDRLSSELKETIKTASVLGREFALLVLGNLLQLAGIISGEREFSEQMEMGCRENIWDSMSELSYIFKHALIRDAAYEIQLKDTLRSLHNYAGSIIEELYQDNLLPHYEELADHYEKAENLEKAIEYLEKAGDSSRENYRNSQALDFYDRLMYFLNKADGRDLKEKTARALIRQADVLQLTGKWNRAKEIFENSLRISEELQYPEIIVDTLNKLGNLLQCSGNYPDARIVLKRAESIAKREGYLKGLKNAFWNIGSIYEQQGDYKKAIRYFQKDYEICMKIKDEKGLAKAIGNIGIIHYYQGRYEKAMDCYEELLALSERFGDKKGISLAMTNMGIVYRARGSFKKAIECYEKELEISEELGDIWGIGNAYVNIGNACVYLGDYKKAIEYYNKKLLICKELGDKRGRSITVGNMGVVYKERNEFKKAMECFQEEMEISEELGDKSGISSAVSNIGTVHYLLGEFREAMECFEKDLKICEGMGDKWGISIALNNIGNIYADYGDHEKAMKYFTRQKTLFEELGDRRGISIALANIGSLACERGQYDSALEFYERAIEISRDLDIKYELCQQLAGKANILFSLKKNDEAMTAINESAILAEKLDIKDMQFAASLLRNKIEKNAEALSSMLKDMPVSDEQEACLNHELWKLTGEEQYRKKARSLCQKLIKATPKAKFMKMIEELG